MKLWNWITNLFGCSIFLLRTLTGCSARRTWNENAHGKHNNDEKTLQNKQQQKPLTLLRFFLLCIPQIRQSNRNWLVWFDVSLKWIGPTKFIEQTGRPVASDTGTCIQLREWRMWQKDLLFSCKSLYRMDNKVWKLNRRDILQWTCEVRLQQ